MAIKITKGTEVLNAVAPVDLQFRLNEQLDGGKFFYYKTEKVAQGVNEPLTMYTVTIDNYVYSLLGFDSRAFVAWADKTAGTAVYKHEVNLVEPTKRLQGLLVDGFAVTQSEDTPVSLWDVANRVIYYTPFGNMGTPKYVLTPEDNVVKVLKNTVSPQFKWNTQTTLFEVLCDIGAVVGAFPRLLPSAMNEYVVVAFDFVNETVEEITDLYGEMTDIGENIDESEYCTALGAVVENLQEE